VRGEELGAATSWGLGAPGTAAARVRLRGFGRGRMRVRGLCPFVTRCGQAGGPRIRWAFRTPRLGPSEDSGFFVEVSLVSYCWGVLEFFGLHFVFSISIY
jgi:hypothetical protein